MNWYPLFCPVFRSLGKKLAVFEIYKENIKIFASKAVGLMGLIFYIVPKMAVNK